MISNYDGKNCETTGFGPPLAEDNWAHRSEGMRCHSCMWFLEKDPKPNCIKIGRCRRHAPTMSGFPVVYGTDWCGDHKLK